MAYSQGWRVVGSMKPQMLLAMNQEVCVNVGNMEIYVSIFPLHDPAASKKQLPANF